MLTGQRAFVGDCRVKVWRRRSCHFSAHRIPVIDPDCRAGLTFQTPNVTYLLAVPKVYPICLFASLNSRIVISREMTNHMTFVSIVSDPWLSLLIPPFPAGGGAGRKRRSMAPPDIAGPSHLAREKCNTLTGQTGASLSLPSSETLSRNIGHHSGAVTYDDANDGRSRQMESQKVRSPDIIVVSKVDVN